MKGAILKVSDTIHMTCRRKIRETVNRSESSQGFGWAWDDYQKAPENLKGEATFISWFWWWLYSIMGFPDGSVGKETHLHCRRLKGCGIDPCVRTIPWRRACQPTRVFLAGESHGQRSLVGYSPKGLKELDKTERLTLSLSLFSYAIIYMCQKLQNCIWKEAAFIGWKFVP